jgi:hypothetical protein
VFFAVFCDAFLGVFLGVFPRAFRRVRGIRPGSIDLNDA